MNFGKFKRPMNIPKLMTDKVSKKVNTSTLSFDFDD